MAARRRRSSAASSRCATRPVFPAPEAVLARTPEAMRGCGLSANKVLAIRDIAEKAAAGVVPTRAAARRLSDEALIERLVPLRGVGRWTVEMLLIFTLGRPDILPVDDFGVREGYRVAAGLDEQPKPRALAEIGQAWAPLSHHRRLVFLARRRPAQGRPVPPAQGDLTPGTAEPDRAPAPRGGATGGRSWPLGARAAGHGAMPAPWGRLLGRSNHCEAA